MDYHQKAGGLTNVHEKTEFLRGYFSENPDELAQYKATAEGMSDECYSFSTKRRPPRPFLRYKGERYRFSIRTLLYFAIHGEVEMTMPLFTCTNGCYNPHHAVCTRKGAVNADKKSGTSRMPFTITTLRKHVEDTNRRRAAVSHSEQATA